MDQLELASQPIPEYRTIPLSQGQLAVVDSFNYDWLMQWKWYARWDPKMQSFYAQRNGKWIDQKNNKREPLILMHRQILGLEPRDPRQGDHRDSGKTLLNVISNLRIVGQEKNKMNRRIYRNNKTGFKGVSFDQKMRKYRADIQVDGEGQHLGYRKTAKAAHEELYVPAALRLHGEYARLA